MLINIEKPIFDDLITSCCKTLIIVVLKESSGACELIKPIIKKLSDIFSEETIMLSIESKYFIEKDFDYEFTEYPGFLIVRDGNLLGAMSGVYPLEYYSELIGNIISKH